MGTLYGLVTYEVMNFAVVPLRFDTGPPPSLVGFATHFSFEILLVFPTAWLAARYLPPLRPAEA